MRGFREVEKMLKHFDYFSAKRKDFPRLQLN